MLTTMFSLAKSSPSQGPASGTVTHIFVMVVTNSERFTLSQNGHDEKHSNPQIIMTLKEFV